MKITEKYFCRKLIFDNEILVVFRVMLFLIMYKKKSSIVSGFYRADNLL